MKGRMEQATKMLLVSAYVEICGETIQTSPNAAFKDMRKPMSRDEERRSVRPNGRDITVGREGITM
jgi:hypothetical protein